MSAGPSPRSTLGGLLAESARRLGSSTEARWMVEAATGSASGSLSAHHADPVSDDIGAVVDRWVARRVAGEPLQYVLGSWDFRGIDVSVDRRVLIPRPETETVVGIALELLGVPGAAGPRRPRRVVDLGTGSGAIALALAVEGPADLEVWATDRSADALAVARANLDALARRDPAAAGRVRLAEGSWFESLAPELAGSLSMVVSNPPYVAEGEWPSLDPVVRDFEPRGALVSGETGLESITEIVTRAGRWLADGGRLVVELAPHQGEAVSETAAGAGYGDVRVEDDLAGRARALVATWPGA